MSVGFAAFFAVQNGVRVALQGYPVDVRSLSIEMLSRWLTTGALAPAIGWLVHVLPIERGRTAGRITLHVLAGLVFSILVCISLAAFYQWFHLYGIKEPPLETVRRLILMLLGMNFVVFSAIDGAYHGVRHHREIRARDQLAASLQARLTEARLDTLRAQLNPHFLFNTLNAASTLAVTGERDQVVRTLTSLSDLLRVSLDQALPQEIPLDQEMDLVNAYLDIQRIRFGKRLTLAFDIAPEVHEVLMPSMMLQPLLENAIQHGIEARPGPGLVRIAARRDRDLFVIRVEDTGPGFAPVTEVRPRPGIGLANTRARLAELYGEAQSLECGNLPDGGAFVQVALPYRTTRTAGAMA